MKLTLNGKPLDFNAPPPLAQRAIRVLDKLPLGALLDTQELAKKLNSTPGSLREGACNALKEGGYYLIAQNKSMYGSKATISQLRKELNGNGN